MWTRGSVEKPQSNHGLSCGGRLGLRVVSGIGSNAGKHHWRRTASVSGSLYIASTGFGAGDSKQQLLFVNFQLFILWVPAASNAQQLQTSNEDIHGHGIDNRERSDSGKKVRSGCDATPQSRLSSISMCNLQLLTETTVDTRGYCEVQAVWSSANSRRPRSRAYPAVHNPWRKKMRGSYAVW